jgi:hypothetical protein
LAFGTSAILATCDEALLWIICNIARKYRMYLLNSTITAAQINSILTCLHEWGQNEAHGFMKETLISGTIFLFGQVPQVFDLVN